MRRQEAAIDLLQSALGAGERARLRVDGGCMSPLLRDGDLVEIVLGEPETGGIAVARSEMGGLVCHRVLGRTEHGYRLAGDRSPAREHPRESVVGTVERVFRDGRVLRFDRGFGRLLDGALARLRLSTEARPTRRLAEVPRRLLLRLRALSWHLAPRT